MGLDPWGADKGGNQTTSSGEQSRDREGRERDSRPYTPARDPSAKMPDDSYNACVALCKAEEFPKCYWVRAIGACVGAGKGPVGALIGGTLSGSRS